MTLTLQDLPLEILRRIALNLEWFNLSFLLQALPNGSVAFDAVFKCKFYSDNYSDNAVWAALIAGEEDEYLYKLLLDNEKNLINWVKSQVLQMELDFLYPGRGQGYSNYVHFGSDYDPSMCIPVDEACDICYAPISTAIDLVNDFIPRAFQLIYQFSDVRTWSDYQQFFSDVDSTRRKHEANMGLYWSIVARVFVGLMVLKCRDERSSAYDLTALFCAVGDYHIFAIEPLILHMISLPMQDYEEFLPGVFKKLFKENVYHLCRNEVCEAISQNTSGNAQDTIAKMELFFEHIETDETFDVGAFLANNIKSDVGIICEWLNDHFKAIDKIKWRKALLEIEDWNLDNAHTNSRTQAVIDLFTDNEIPLWPLFDDFVSPHDNSNESIGILVTLLKAVILNGEKTKDEVEELLLEFMRENSEYKTVIKKVRRRLSNSDKDYMEHLV